MAEEMTEKPTEGTTPGGKYLTRDYLVKNLQKFWNKIKAYIDQQIQLLTNFIGGQIDLKADQTDLNSLESLVNEKANESDLNNLRTTVEDKVSRGELTKGLAGKVDAIEGQGLSTNDFTTAEKEKLKGIEAGANSYTLPTASSSALGGVTTTSKVKSSDGFDACPIIDGVPYYKDTTYSNATKNTAGLMSSTDKTKLDGLKIESNKEIENNLIQVLDTTDNTGNFSLKFSGEFKHLKMYFYCKDDLQHIEKIAIKSENELVFGNDSNVIFIENPDGSGILQTSVYSFYVEYLEMSNGDKYEPFILKVNRQIIGIGSYSLGKNILIL